MHDHLFALTAVVFFILAAFVAGGVASFSAPWLVPGGLAALAIAMIGYHFSNRA